jgi:hypothetical protein
MTLPPPRKPKLLLPALGAIVILVALAIAIYARHS